MLIDGQREEKKKREKIRKEISAMFPCSNVPWILFGLKCSIPGTNPLVCLSISLKRIERNIKRFRSHIKHVYMNLMFEYIVDLPSPYIARCARVYECLSVFCQFFLFCCCYYCCVCVCVCALLFGFIFI